MLNNNASRMWVVGTVWLTALVIMLASSVAMGARLSTTALLLVIGVAPAIVMLLIGFGAPPPTVAELLHSVDVKDGR
jgi:hypothetical protein